MKRLLTGALALIFTLAASATTLNPIQLLNPSGSTSGQAIVSTGPSTSPAWANVAATSLAAQAANTVVANVTGSTASPTAFAIPSCSATSSSLGYTSGTGFICNGSINASVLLGFNWAIPGAIGATTPNSGAFTTLAASSTITPSQTAGIAGTTTNNNANAGSVGEYPTPGASIGTSLTSGTSANCASITLGAGDWDVQGTITFAPAGTTTTTYGVSGISTTSATLPASNTGASVQLTGSPTGGVGLIALTPVVRESLSGSTTIFLVGNSVFAVSTMTCSGFIRARRIR